jgi:hypothetical protein
MVSDGYGIRLIMTMDGDFLLDTGCEERPEKKTSWKSSQTAKQNSVGKLGFSLSCHLWGKCGVIFTSPDSRH